MGFKETVKDLRFILKFVIWLLLLIAVIYLNVDYSTYYWYTNLMICSLLGYTMILTVAVTFMLFDKWDEEIDMWFLLAGAILCIAAGVCSIIFSGQRNSACYGCYKSTEVIVAGVMSLAAAVFMIIDVVINIFHVC